MPLKTKNKKNAMRYVYGVIISSTYHRLEPNDTYSVFSVVEPCHKGENTPRNAHYETEAKEHVPNTIMSLEPVVNHSSNTRRDEPVDHTVREKPWNAMLKATYQPIPT